MASYDPQVMVHVPSLEVAHASVFENPSFDQVLSKFRALASKYGQNNTYGLALVHRHAEVSPGHRLMDFKQTLQPFPLNDTADNLHGAPIRAKSLALTAGGWKPYEYELGSPDLPQQDFFADVQALLEQNGSEGLHVGLRRYSPSDPEELEITESGGVSVKIPWNSVVSPSPGYKTTFWAFPSEDGGEMRNYKCSCRDTGSSTNSNHNHIDCN
ncbi:hypothetical protein B0T24DRAFT_719015 [Lasiosphaeria ovina]|uniref:Uncharacterized protein n=1 Tax=Lasiosphaeria ovina TaxID=92902 RepID=A0AAE0NB28_9PEZI|nr:hypothetical protein B0T24DRAFT_719015 [Lasiosphaeria ovina]